MIAIGLGGNHPDSERWIRSAMRVLGNYMFAAKPSSLYQSKALGPGTRPFVNAVVVGLAGGRPLKEWVTICQQMEKAAGRKPDDEETWGDRTLDCDILIYEREIVANSDLQVPHPQMHRRPFVMAPLAEVAPDLVHPILLRKMKDIWGDLEASLEEDAGGTILS